METIAEEKPRSGVEATDFHVKAGKSKVLNQSKSNQNFVAFYLLII